MSKITKNLSYQLRGMSNYFFIPKPSTYLYFLLCLPPRGEDTENLKKGIFMTEKINVKQMSITIPSPSFKVKDIQNPPRLTY